ncbi:hypothetical protein FACS189499_04140 [Clostridia bacterium]|nr:hypothetical protein FACS189499_04140 [Clostridia bacterium]
MIDFRKIKRFVIPNLPYAGMFWLFNKCGEAYRMSKGNNILQRLLNTTANLNAALSKPMLSFDMFDIAAGFVGAAMIYIIVYIKKKNAKKWMKDIEYGSARWGKAKDIEPYVDKMPENNVILTATESLMMNGRPYNPKYARNKNVLIIGGSGSGKTRFWLKPNLMQMHSSYVVTDPKGTVLIETGRMLQRGSPKVEKKLGKNGKPLKDKKGNVITQIVEDKNGKIVYEPYEIKVLNTIDFSKSMHYNPFSYIRSEKDILKFVTALIANTKGEGKGGDDFWVKAETLLYCALVGIIHYDGYEDEKNMNTLVEMINLMETREDVEDFKNPIDFLFEELEIGNEEEGIPPQPDHFAVRQYKKYKLAAGKTAKSILISCGARLAVFDIKELRDLMAYDEMELDTIGDRKTAMFIIISDTDDSFSFVAALMYSQLSIYFAIRRITNTADGPCSRSLLAR